MNKRLAPSFVKIILGMLFVLLLGLIGGAILVSIYQYLFNSKLTTISVYTQNCNIPGIYKYADEKIDLSKDQLSSLVQSMVDQTYKKAFLHLGDYRDFDHGHILYDPDMKPVAILYHTQEEAFNYNRDHPGSRYDYVDIMGRNWVQRISDKKVENALKYLKRGSSYPNRLNHFTIHEDVIDYEKMGLKVISGFSIQFMFTDVTSESISEECRGQNSNLAVLRLPTGKTTTIVFMTNDHFWPFFQTYIKGKK